MYGLIWKDFLVLRKTLRLYVLFLLGYLGMALLGIFDLTFVTTFCVVILMILPISAFSYDEFARWDRYARTLPLSSRQIVGGRYLFVLLLLLVVAAIGAVKSELGARYAVAVFAFQVTVAWIVAFVVHSAGILLGLA